MSNHNHVFMGDLLMTLQSTGFNDVDGILGYIRRRPADGISDLPC